MICENMKLAVPFYVFQLALCPSDRQDICVYSGNCTFYSSNMDVYTHSHQLVVDVIFQIHCSSLQNLKRSHSPSVALNGLKHL